MDTGNETFDLGGVVVVSNNLSFCIHLGKGEIFRNKPCFDELSFNTIVSTLAMVVRKQHSNKNLHFVKCQFAMRAWKTGFAGVSAGVWSASHCVI